MIVHECAVVNSVLYVTALVVLIVYSCLKTTKNIIIYERIIAVLTSKNKKYCISRRKKYFYVGPARLTLLKLNVFTTPEGYLYRSCTEIRLDDRRARKRPRRLSVLARPSSCVALAGRFTSWTFRTEWGGNAHTAFRRKDGLCYFILFFITQQ